MLTAQQSSQQSYQKGVQGQVPRSSSAWCSKSEAQFKSALHNMSEDGAASELATCKLQLLQAQCIVDAKERELRIVRQSLSDEVSVQLCKDFIGDKRSALRSACVTL